MESKLEKEKSHNSYWGNIFTKEYLIDEYIVKKKHSTTIAEEHNTTSGAVYYYLRKHNIPTRTLSETHKKWSTNEQYFKTESHNSWYIIGFITADGSIVQKKSSKLRFNLSIKDLEVLEFIQLELDSDQPIRYTTRNDPLKPYRYCSIEFPSNEICKDLEKYNIAPRKTGKEKLPEIPDKYKFDYLRGLFDGDGSFLCSKKTSKNGFKNHSYSFSICSASESFINEINNGLLSNIGIIRKQIEGIYEARIHKYQNIINVAEEMYATGDFGLSRKKERFEKIKRKDVF